MNFVKVTALKAEQENETYVNVDRIVSVGTFTLTLPVPGTGSEDKEPELEEKTMTVVNLDGAPAIFVKEAPRAILEAIGK